MLARMLQNLLFKNLIPVSNFRLLYQGVAMFTHVTARGTSRYYGNVFGGAHRARLANSGYLLKKIREVYIKGTAFIYNYQRGPRKLKEGRLVIE